MAVKTGLDVSLFSLGPPDTEISYLATLKTVAIRAENEVVDARGIADPFEFNQVVKQAQALDFTVNLDRGDSGDTARRMTNLDVTVWTFDAADYISQIQSGEILITVPAKDRSALKNLERYPVPVGGIQIEVRAEVVVVDSAAFANQLMTSPISGFHVAVGITLGGSSFSLPMMFQSATHKADRGELQMERVVLQARGAPSGSESASLLGAVLSGTTMFGFELDTGAGHYGTAAAADPAPAQYGVLTELTVKFNAGAIVEMTGTLEIQGQMVVS